MVIEMFCLKCDQLFLPFLLFFGTFKGFLFKGFAVFFKAFFFKGLFRNFGRKTQYI